MGKVREVYAVVVNDTDEIMIKLLPDKSKWFFPGEKIEDQTDPITFLEALIGGEIGGIQLLEGQFLGAIMHDGVLMGIYLFHCKGMADRHAGAYTAKFTNDLVSYPFSSLGRKILALYGDFSNELLQV